jgi:hypothetical protein
MCNGECQAAATSAPEVFYYWRSRTFQVLGRKCKTTKGDFPRVFEGISQGCSKVVFKCSAAGFAQRLKCLLGLVMLYANKRLPPPGRIDADNEVRAGAGNKRAKIRVGAGHEGQNIS